MQRQGESTPVETLEPVCVTGTDTSSRKPVPRLPVLVSVTKASFLHDVASRFAPSVGDNPNIIRVVAMDSNLPTMPIMMKAGMGDMFDIVGNDAISMRGKTRQGHYETLCEVELWRK